MFTEPTPAVAALAVSAGAKVIGFAVRYPDGTFLSGEFEDRGQFIEELPAWLGNGLFWHIYFNGEDRRLLGNLEALTLASPVELRPIDGITERPGDGELRKIGWWRRAMSRANDAARILHVYERPREV